MVSRLLHNRWLQCRNNRLIEHILKTLLRKCRALDILDRAQLPRQPLSHLGRDRPLLLPLQFLNHLHIVSQIDLGADDKARNTWTVMSDLWHPFLLDVFKRSW